MQQSLNLESVLRPLAQSAISKNTRRNRLIIIAQGVFYALNRMDATFYMALRALNPRETFALVMRIDKAITSATQHNVVNALRDMRHDYVSDEDEAF